ncbi:nitric oxide synthase [Tribonema minus]|uniref:Nitric oxide synthase n=1 Tax=Tribonema minus TaxID=303371 RepID=A0A836CN33_9STRA|nr:nitric oxide synthase [Tribonema minus]
MPWRAAGLLCCAPMVPLLSYQYSQAPCSKFRMIFFCVLSSRRPHPTGQRRAEPPSAQRAGSMGADTAINGGALPNGSAAAPNGSAAAPNGDAAALSGEAALNGEASLNGSASLEPRRTTTVPPKDVAAAGRKCPFVAPTIGEDGIPFLVKGDQAPSTRKLTQLAENQVLTVTEVALSGVEGRGRDFRLRMRVMLGDVLVRQEDLPQQDVLTWPLHLQPAAEERVVVIFQMKPEGSSLWDDAAAGELLPLAHFDRDDVDYVKADVALPWGGAQGMKATFALVIEKVVRGVSAAIAVKRDADVHKNRVAALLKAHAEATSKITRDMKAATLGGVRAMAAEHPLTDVEIVIVKDSYNKMLAWHEIAMEYLAERFFFLYPEMATQFGPAADNFQEQMMAALDGCVRTLHRHTEEIGREAYRSVLEGAAAAKWTHAGDDFFRIFAELGLQAKHWETLRNLWVQALLHSPYQEDYEREDMERGEESAAYRFFTNVVMERAYSAIVDVSDVFDVPENFQILMESWRFLEGRKKEMGVAFYTTFFANNPELIPLFARSDMDALSGHLFEALEVVMLAVPNFEAALPILHSLGRQHVLLGIPSYAHNALGGALWSVFAKHMPTFAGDSAESQKLRFLWEAVFKRTAYMVVLPMFNVERVIKKGYEWVELVAKEKGWSAKALERRKEVIKSEVLSRGTYTHTEEELVHGARVAWRNSAKCIGRIAWNSLLVRDRRNVTDPDEMMAECLEHQRLATADGSLKAVMTVFRPLRPLERLGPRFWNVQLIRFACYELPDGTTMGDRANRELTKALISFGWQPPEPRGEFDVLPIVIETPGQGARMYHIPPEYVRTVVIEHPEFPEVVKLNLKWCVVPTVTGFTMDLGGIKYPAVPFNGWFMNTEVGRDLMDSYRYDKGIELGKAMGFDTDSTTNFWRDKVFLELNIAVMHSFRKHGCSIVDHQTASQQFITHDLREKRAVVPPLSSGLTAVFGHEMREFVLDHAAYRYQAEIWDIMGGSEMSETDPSKKASSQAAKKLLILFASETGTAEGYAYSAAKKLRPCKSTVKCMENVEPSTLSTCGADVVILITSTFGDGNTPGNGKAFVEKLQATPRSGIEGITFCTLAIGSTVYPDYCLAGTKLNAIMKKMGGIELLPIAKADELKNQANTVAEWIGQVANALGLTDLVKEAGRGSEEEEDMVVTLLEKTDDAVTAAKAAGKQLPSGFELCPVVRNSEILEVEEENSGAFRSTRFLQFDLANSTLRYHTGDHAAILPKNDVVEVADMCELLKVSPHQWVNVTGDRIPFAVPAQVKHVFMEELDLATSSNNLLALLTLLYSRATSGPGADRAEEGRLEAMLESLKVDKSSEKAVAAAERDILATYVTVSQLLQAFPKATSTITLSDMFKTLTKIKPRFYSIASAHEMWPTDVQLTVGVLQIPPAKGKAAEHRLRKGMCSNYLSSTVAGKDTIRLSIRTSSFRLPQDMSGAPVIMVGPGTGISPMLGFLQAREVAAKGAANGSSIGPCTVYFGCRGPPDFLHQEQMRKWESTGIITDLQVAFSRIDPNKKVYVQNLIAEQREKLWTLLQNPKCHYYVCGDSKMADDVHLELLRTVHAVGRLARKEAVDFFNKMKAEGRMQSDTWGVTLHHEDK